MAAEQNEIRRQIEAKRREISRDLDALEARLTNRVTAATDWQRPVRERPWTSVVAGLLVGLVLGWIVGG